MKRTEEKADAEARITELKTELKRLQDSGYNCFPHPSYTKYSNNRETNLFRAIDILNEIDSLRLSLQ